MFHPRSYLHIGSHWNKLRHPKKHSSGKTVSNFNKFNLKMANTLSSMTNSLRNLVSGKRIRYKENGFNLDLAYISSNIIAMGYPAENIESIYRNRSDDVFKFLEENHFDHYRIYNLCLERNYDKSKFHGRVAVYPFEDHNPPTIELIQRFCEDVDIWLNADAKNVAAVHCKAGKGRTGTMICCYLLYSGQHNTAADALSCYDEKRTKDRKGVTIPSQRRYVQYFSNLIRSGIPYKKRSLQFCEIRFTEADNLCQGIVHCSISELQDTVQQLQSYSIDFRKSLTLDMTDSPLIISGDIKVELTHKTSRKKIFHFWFNTFFVYGITNIEADKGETKLVYTLNKNEIDDAHKDREHKSFPEDFKVQLVFCADNSGPKGDGRTRSHEKYQSDGLTHNSYDLPQNSSSGSDLNHICDHKSLSSVSISSLGGGIGEQSTDCCVGREERIKSATNNKESVINNEVNVHNLLRNNYVSMPMATALSSCDNGSSYFDVSILGAANKSHNTKSNLQNENFVNAFVQVVSASVSSQKQYKNMHPSITQPHQQLLHQPSLNVTNVSSRDDNSELMNRSSMHGGGPQTFLNSHTSSNSSKSSSISSHSSSSAAIGGEDNEQEDWESGECSTKPLELLLLSSLTSPSSVTVTTTITTTTISTNTTTTTTTTHQSVISSSNVRPSVRYRSNNCSSTDSSRCFKGKINKHNDDDDDEDYDYPNYLSQKAANDAISSLTISTIPKANSIAMKSSNMRKTENADHTQTETQSIPLVTATPPLSTRRKLRHLLSHKTIDTNSSSVRKSFLKKHLKSAGSSGAISFVNLDNETTIVSSNGNSKCAGLPTTSKQRLKMKFRKKLKLSQWFQNRFHSDPVNFQECFESQTVLAVRRARNNVSSNTPSTFSAESAPKLSGSLSSCPNFADFQTNALMTDIKQQISFTPTFGSDISLTAIDQYDDYYSSICDNQLSFNNSPCKSPRSLTDIGRSRNSFNSFASSHGHNSLNIKSPRSKLSNNINELCNQDPSNVVNGSSNVVIVAAKSAHTLTIGFKVTDNCINSSNDNFETNPESTPTTGSSVYFTPSSSNLEETIDAFKSNTPFIFPKMNEEIDNVFSNGCFCHQNEIESTSDLQTFMSKDIKIFGTNSSPEEIAGVCSLPSFENDCSIKQSKRVMKLYSVNGSQSSQEEAFTTACNNSNSSGFCTSECYTNSSSSHCSCNPLEWNSEYYAPSKSMILMTPVSDIEKSSKD